MRSGLNAGGGAGGGSEGALGHPACRLQDAAAGALADQIRRGGLKMATLFIFAALDIFTAGREEMECLPGEVLISEYRPYARDSLAILVPHFDPAGTCGHEHLCRTGC